MLLKGVAFFCLFIGSALSDQCPSVYKCGCFREEAGLTLSCSGVRGKWDIKAAFDGAKNFDPSVAFKKLELIDTSLFDIPANAITNFKFEEIVIAKNENLENMSPYAFNGTQSYTKILQISDNPLLEQVDTESGSNVFDLVKQFNQLTKLSLSSNSRYSFIPDFAFGTQPELLDFTMMSSGVKTIGSHAFANLPKLQRIFIPWNAFGYGGIKEDSFHGLTSQPDVRISLSGITTLDESHFRILFETAKSVEIGNVSGCKFHCNYKPIFDCPKYSWICKSSDVFRGKIRKVWCNSNGDDIFDYCDGKMIKDDIN